MAHPKSGDTVNVHYTGKLDDGTVFDSSSGRDPLQFTMGGGQIIPGFEEAVSGLNPGESKTVRIPAQEAYGPHYPDMVMEVPRTELPEGMEPQIGDQLQMESDDGETVIVTITEAKESSITLDANHPLAGEDLTFEIELVEIV